MLARPLCHNQLSARVFCDLPRIFCRDDERALVYFNGLSEQIGVPYQSFINSHLRDCAQKNVVQTS